MSLKGLLAAAVAGAFAAVATAQPAPQPPPAATQAKPLTQDGGQPVGNNQNTRTAGETGPALLDNFHLLEKMARFDRERIPERVVHARGVGAHGEFAAGRVVRGWAADSCGTGAGRDRPTGPAGS